MTIIAAAFCPHPPLLVPEVAGNEQVAVREPAVAAVRWLTRQPIEQLVVMGADSQAKEYPAGSRGGFAGYGVERGVQLPGSGASEEARLPLPLAVAAWILEEAGWLGRTVGFTTDQAGGLPAELPRALDADRPAVGLLVMGDGSARRSEKAPGWLDERSEAFDAAVSRALSSGESEQLAVDLGLGEALLAAGAPAWTAAAGLLSGRRWSGKVSYDDAPYGVGYLVATWSPKPAL